MPDTFGITDTIYVEREPSSPDKAVTVYQLPGEEGLNSIIDIETHSVRVQCRDAKGGRKSAFGIIGAVRDALHRLVEFTTSTSRIIQILQSGSIELMEFDENDRPRYSAVFIMQRTAKI